MHTMLINVSGFKFLVIKNNAQNQNLAQCATIFFSIDAIVVVRGIVVVVVVEMIYGIRSRAQWVGIGNILR